MVYTFAGIGAALGMRVEDVYVQKRRTWVRLHEKGGKGHEMPCHHNLDAYHTQPSPEIKLLIEKLKLQLPSQPPPRLLGQKQGYEIELRTVRWERVLWWRPLLNLD
jgi:hypothetical protein